MYIGAWKSGKLEKSVFHKPRGKVENWQNRYCSSIFASFERSFEAASSSVWKTGFSTLSYVPSSSPR